MAWPTSTRIVILYNRSVHFAQLYGPQTKILEDWTKDEVRVFDWLFNGS